MGLSEDGILENQKRGQIYNTPHLIFYSFFLLFAYFCRFFQNERFFTVYPLRVHAFFCRKFENEW